MDCKTSEKYIPGFLSRTLSYDELRLFIDHIENCPNCMEELGINYLIDEAIPRIELGESVNLNTEIRQRIAHAQRANSLHYVCSNIFRSIEVVAGIGLVLSAARAVMLFVLPYIAI